MFARKILMATALSAFAASPLFAQRHGHEQGEAGGAMMGQDQMHGAMMGGGMIGMGSQMHPGPAMLLRAGDALNLTEDQTAGLTTLRDQARESHRQHMQAAREARQRAVSALEGDSPDFGTYEAALREAAEHMVTAHVSMARSSLEARELLTPEQRAKLDDARTRKGMTHGGMMHGGTVQGGTTKGWMGGSGHSGHH